MFRRLKEYSDRAGLDWKDWMLAALRIATGGLVGYVLAVVVHRLLLLINLL